ncbi:MAG: hypothetical protein J6A92_07945 [Lachnospiraceae bacterium]|nr:hypothetical protein [Lachnospiraceae bacterium]
MILVDIYIPAVEKNFDFMLDENVPVEQVMTEISEMISKKAMGNRMAQAEDFLLCSMDTKKMLNPELSLYMNHIQDGSKLIFV